jgi:hypothetical protein
MSDPQTTPPAEPTPDGAFLEKIDDLQEALIWYAEGMKISDPLKRLDYWQEDPSRFSRVTTLVLAEAADMKKLATNLKEHHEALAANYRRRLDLRFS